MKLEQTMEEVHFADETPTPQSEGLGCWKVMIVDDDDFVHKVTELTLGDYHYQNTPFCTCTPTPHLKPESFCRSIRTRR